MNWEIIETPSQQRFEVAEQANHCVKWLKIQGFEVLRVYKGLNGAPLITIRTSPLCDKFEGAIAVYERSLKGVQRYKKVMRLDCEVRWEDKAGAA